MKVYVVIEEVCLGSRSIDDYGKSCMTFASKEKAHNWMSNRYNKDLKELEEEGFDIDSSLAEVDATITDNDYNLMLYRWTIIETDLVEEEM